MWIESLETKFTRKSSCRMKVLPFPLSCHSVRGTGARHKRGFGQGDMNQSVNKTQTQIWQNPDLHALLAHEEQEHGVERNEKQNIQQEDQSQVPQGKEQRPEGRNEEIHGIDNIVNNMSISFNIPSWKANSKRQWLHIANVPNNAGKNCMKSCNQEWSQTCKNIKKLLFPSKWAQLLLDMKVHGPTTIWPDKSVYRKKHRYSTAGLCTLLATNG